MARRIGLLLLLSLCPLSAEIVQLRDGRTMRGRITAQDTETISLRTQDGDYLIYRDQVYRILLDDPAVLRAQEAAEAEKEARVTPQTQVRDQIREETKVPESPGKRPETPGKRDEKKEEKHANFLFGLSAGGAKHDSVYKEIFVDDKTADYVQQGIALTSSVSYPYEFSESKLKTYAAYMYYESGFWAVGAEGETGSHSSSYQLMESLTNSGRFYAGAGSFTKTTDQIYRLRAGILAGSESWTVQPWIFAGPVFLASRSKGNQTEVLTNPTTLAAAAVYSPSLQYKSSAQGLEAATEIRWLISGGMELRGKGAFGQMKGGLHYDEFRLPLQDATAYAALTAYPTWVIQSAQLRTVLTQYGAAFYFPLGDMFRVFVDLGMTRVQYKLSNLGTLRLPDNALAPGATANGDLYRYIFGKSFNDTSRAYRVGVEFRL
ncbi:MAG TPA: hypothetical protein PKE49_03890 [Leptospiraceae bacterium]|nr:hypothetical protein [Leptospirales bacterium]HMW58345.1 hypothetical protein [Leptospiraceae bacterium]HMX55636.1 hypothetical protein [Leptospiraceae bacterium]HMY46214.1 hypothetical protein [Leptospiraceae bacterium]HNE24704.1 hypothetical protein [Leptospiraceae bacterium]